MMLFTLATIGEHSISFTFLRTRKKAILSVWIPKMASQGLIVDLNTKEISKNGQF